MSSRQKIKTGKPSLCNRILLVMLVLTYIVTFVPMCDIAQGLKAYAEDGFYVANVYLAKETTSLPSDKLPQDNLVDYDHNQAHVTRGYYDAATGDFGVTASVGNMRTYTINNNQDRKPYVVVLEFSESISDLVTAAGDPVLYGTQNDASNYYNGANDNKYLVLWLDASKNGTIELLHVSSSRKTSINVNVTDSSQYTVLLPSEESTLSKGYRLSTNRNEVGSGSDRKIELQRASDVIGFTLTPDTQRVINKTPTLGGEAFAESTNETWYREESVGYLTQYISDNNWKNGNPVIDLTDAFSANTTKYHYALLDTTNLQGAYAYLTYDGRQISDTDRLNNGRDVTITIIPNRGHRLSERGLQALLSKQNQSGSTNIELTNDNGIYTGSYTIDTTTSNLRDTIKIEGEFYKNESYNPDIAVKVRNDFEHVTVTVNPDDEWAAEGDPIIVTVKPDKGYDFSEAPRINDTAATRLNDGSYQLTVAATDNGGIDERAFYINVSNVKLDKVYTIKYITYYNFGTVAVYTYENGGKGAKIEDGAKVKEGTNLKFEATLNSSDYRVCWNIERKSEGKRVGLTPYPIDVFHVDGEGDTLEIIAGIRALTDRIVTFPENDVIVTTNGRTLRSGDSVRNGDVLYISAIVPEGKKLISLTANGKDIKDTGTYSVLDDDVDIKAEFTYIPLIPGGGVDPGFRIFTITIPEDITVSTLSGEVLESGAQVHENDVLFVEVDTVPDGMVAVITAIGAEVVNNRAIVVLGTSDVTVDYRLEEAPDDPGSDPDATTYTITIPENVTVTTLSDKKLNSGDQVRRGDILFVTVKVPEGKRLVSLTVKGARLINDSVIVVGSTDIVIEAEFENIPFVDPDPDDKTATITIPDNVTVTKDTGEVLISGEQIFVGDVLTVTVDVPEGYKLESLRVNDNPVDNGYKIKVYENENIIITVSFASLTPDDDNPGGNNPGGNTPGGNNPGGNNPGGNNPGGNNPGGNNPGNGGNGSSGNGGNGSTNNPSVGNGDDETVWDSVLNTINSTSVKTVTVDMNGVTVLPASVLQAIKDKGIKLVLKLSDTVTWTIDGNDVSKVSSDIDLKVNVGTSGIPDSALKELADGRSYLPFSLVHNGEFGFTAVLTIKLGEAYNGRTAQLYWYDESKFKASGEDTVKDGKVSFVFTHASDWVIVLSNGAQPGTPGNTNPGVPQITDPNGSQNGNNSNNNPNTGVKMPLSVVYATVSSAAFCMLMKKKED